MLRVGFGLADVTSPPGSAMGAFPVKQHIQPRLAEGARDPLMVKSLAFSDDQETVVVVSGDLPSWRFEDLGPIRERIVRELPEIKKENLVFCATHTHSSLDSLYLMEGERGLPDLQDKAVQAVLDSLGDLATAEMRVGRVEAPYNHNRRVIEADGKARMALEHEPGVTTGATDPELTVLKFERAGRDTILLIHWTAHALCLGRGNRRYSADYPGALAAWVGERRPGAKVVFLNGAAGNIHPRRCMRDGDEALKWVGERLGEKALEAVDASRIVDAPALAFLTATVEYASRAKESLVLSPPVSCLRFEGSNSERVAIGFMPGEQYVESQLAFKDALAPSIALMVAYADSWIGYVPVREAYAQGGYGVDFFQGDPADTHRTSAPAGTAERMVAVLIDLARKGLG